MLKYVVTGHGRVRFQALAFDSYLKVVVAISAAAGFVYALAALVVSLVGSQVLLTALPFVDPSGIGAALLAVLVLPMAFAAAGVVLAALTHVPFVLFLRVVGGIPLAGEWVELPLSSPAVRTEATHF